MMVLVIRAPTRTRVQLSPVLPTSLTMMAISTTAVSLVVHQLLVALVTRAPTKTRVRLSLAPPIILISTTMQWTVARLVPESAIAVPLPAMLPAPKRTLAPVLMPQQLRMVALIWNIQVTQDVFQQIQTKLLLRIVI